MLRCDQVFSRGRLRFEQTDSLPIDKFQFEILNTLLAQDLDLAILAIRTIAELAI